MSLFFLENENEEAPGETKQRLKDIFLLSVSHVPWAQVSGKDVHNLLGGTKLTWTTDPSDSVFSGRDWLRNLQGPVQNKECGPTFRNEYGDIRALNQKWGPVWLHVLEQPGKLVPSLEEIL